jgi:hypothetical protein
MPHGKSHWGSKGPTRSIAAPAVISMAPTTSILGLFNPAPTLGPALAVANRKQSQKIKPAMVYSCSDVHWSGGFNLWLHLRDTSDCFKFNPTESGTGVKR